MSDAPKAFAIEAAKGVEIALDDSSDDERFTITVRKDGQAVETHEGVTADSVTTLSSDHFTASHVDAPTPTE